MNMKLNMESLSQYELLILIRKSTMLAPELHTFSWLLTFLDITGKCILVHIYEKLIFAMHLLC